MLSLHPLHFSQGGRVWLYHYLSHSLTLLSLFFTLLFTLFFYILTSTLSPVTGQSRSSTVPTTQRCLFCCLLTLIPGLSSPCSHRPEQLLLLGELCLGHHVPASKGFQSFVKHCLIYPVSSKGRAHRAFLVMISSSGTNWCLICGKVT